MAILKFKTDKMFTDITDDVQAINGHSHIRSLFFNSSENIPIKDRKLLLGKWKRLFFVELDPMRKRELIITFINGSN